MIRGFGLFVILPVLLVMFAFPAQVMAQSFAVVDVDVVLNTADAAKALQKKRNVAREKFLTELSKKEQALGEEGKAIFNQRGVISEEEFASKRQAYEEKLLEIRKATQVKKRAFEEASNKSLLALQTFLTETVQEISKEKGYALVFSARSVVTGAQALNITEETLKRMNAKKKDIPFKIK